LNLTFHVIEPLFDKFRLIHSARTSTTTVDRFVSRIHNLGLHKVLKLILWAEKLSCADEATFLEELSASRGLLLLGYHCRGSNQPEEVSKRSKLSLSWHEDSWTTENSHIIPGSVQLSTDPDISPLTTFLCIPGQSLGNVAVSVPFQIKLITDVTADCEVKCYLQLLCPQSPAMS
jgi:hypothetical protein